MKKNTDLWLVLSGLLISTLITLPMWYYGNLPVMELILIPPLTVATSLLLISLKYGFTSNSTEVIVNQQEVVDVEESNFDLLADESDSQEDTDEFVIEDDEEEELDDFDEIVEEEKPTLKKKKPVTKKKPAAKKAPTKKKPVAKKPAAKKAPVKKAAPKKEKPTLKKSKPSPTSLSNAITWKDQRVKSSFKQEDVPMFTTLEDLKHHVRSEEMEVKVFPATKMKYPKFQNLMEDEDGMMVFAGKDPLVLVERF